MKCPFCHTTSAEGAPRYTGCGLPLQTVAAPVVPSPRASVAAEPVAADAPAPMTAESPSSRSRVVAPARVTIVAAGAAIAVGAVAFVWHPWIPQARAVAHVGAATDPNTPTAAGGGGTPAGVTPITRVPDVTGLSGTAAASLLAGAGLKISVNSAYGSVASQLPAAGTVVSPGREVIVSYDYGSGGTSGDGSSGGGSYLNNDGGSYTGDGSNGGSYLDGGGSYTGDGSGAGSYLGGG
jgi:hypothetical protein